MNAGMMKTYWMSLEKRNRMNRERIVAKYFQMVREELNREPPVYPLVVPYGWESSSMEERYAEAERRRRCLRLEEREVMGRMISTLEHCIYHSDRETLLHTVSLLHRMGWHYHPGYLYGFEEGLLLACETVLGEDGKVMLQREEIGRLLEREERRTIHRRIGI